MTYQQLDLESDGDIVKDSMNNFQNEGGNTNRYFASDGGMMNDNEYLEKDIDDKT